MSSIERDFHKVVDDIARGSAVTTTRGDARDVDVFEDEMKANSLVTGYTFFFILIPAGIPFFLAIFDGMHPTLRLNDFAGQAQFFIVLPFILFLLVITFTWFFAYHNHIQRVASIVRVPHIRRYTIASLAFGATSITTLLCLDIEKFHVYWSVSLVLIFAGYLCALLVVHYFQQLISDLGLKAKDTEVDEYQFWKLLGHYPLGGEYKKLTVSEKNMVYDLRVRELLSLKVILSGWRVSNAALAILILGYSILTLFTGEALAWKREYIAVAQNEAQTSMLATLGSGLSYTTEVIALIALIVTGVLTAGLRSRINPTVYSDEVFLLNRASPLKILGQGGEPTYSNDPAVPSQGEVKMENSNVQKLTLLGQLFPLAQSARVVPAVASGILLFWVSTELLYAISFTIFLMLSFLINDVFDFLTGKDAICHPNRPLPSGRLSIGFALSMTVLVTLSLLASTLGQNTFQSLSILLAAGASFFYSFAAKRLFPAVGTVIWVLAVAISFLGAFGQFQEAHVYVLFFLTFYAREILLDIRDLDADKVLAKGPTLGVLGSKSVLYRMVGALLMLTAVGYLWFTTSPLVFSGALLLLGAYIIVSANGQKHRWLRKVSMFVYVGTFFIAS